MQDRQTFSAEWLPRQLLLSLCHDGYDEWYINILNCKGSKSQTSEKLEQGALGRRNHTENCERLICESVSVCLQASDEYQEKSC